MDCSPRCTDLFLGLSSPAKGAVRGTKDPVLRGVEIRECARCIRRDA